MKRKLTSLGMSLRRASANESEKMARTTNGEQSVSILGRKKIHIPTVVAKQPIFNTILRFTMPTYRPHRM